MKGEFINKTTKLLLKFTILRYRYLPSKILFGFASKHLLFKVLQCQISKKLVTHCLIFICSTSRTFSFQNQADGESAILIRGNFVLQYKHFDFSKAWFSCSSAISVFRQCCSLQWSQEKKSSSDKLKSETLETSLPTWVCVYLKSSRV